MVGLENSVDEAYEVAEAAEVNEDYESDEVYEEASGKTLFIRWLQNTLGDQSARFTAYLAEAEAEAEAEVAAVSQTSENSTEDRGHSDSAIWKQSWP